MALSSRRPRFLGAVLAASALVAACSLVKPVETPEDNPENAQRLADAGQHAQAAHAYGELAAANSVDRDNYELLSAEQWVAAGNVAEAKRALAAVSAAARTQLATSRALVGAEVALADNDPAGALAELARIPVPPQADLAQNYAALRRRSEALLAHPAAGGGAGPAGPAPGGLAPGGLAVNGLPAATALPTQIALLLPLSGRAESVGVAVRDGFVAAYLEQPAATRPRLKIYDTAGTAVAGAYKQAIDDGAGFVVGPLTKDEVAAVAPLGAGRTPVLALNFNDAVGDVANFYQFALLPEDEARMVARRLAAEGKLAGVSLAPNSEWGRRVEGAFADEFTHLGGMLLDSGRYETSQKDFAVVIKQILQVHAVKGEPGTHRPDAAFVFVAAGGASARLIVPQLKFNYAGDVPVYSTSDSFEAESRANADLDGLFFPDMPWMVSTDATTGQIRDAVRGAWPARTARLDRLYAFGFDAYRLVPALQANTLGGSSELAGVTGKLHLDDHNRIRRDLDWAQVRNGVPAAL